MNEQRWIDIGVNLTDSAFREDREQIISQAVQSGVECLIITGTTLAESEEAIELCQRFPGTLFCTAGIHPHYSKDHHAVDYEQLAGLLSETCVVAVGETGLDFNRNFSPPEQQKKAFERQLELACTANKPLFLHERDAHQTQLEILRSYRDHISGAVAHCFTGDKTALYNYLDLDLYIGITGWICDERRGQELQQLVKNIPANRLLLETDAPYLLPRDLRPKPKSHRNLPQYLPHIASRVARLVNKTEVQLSLETTANSRRLFRLSTQE